MSEAEYITDLSIRSYINSVCAAGRSGKAPPDKTRQLKVTLSHRKQVHVTWLFKRPLQYLTVSSQLPKTHLTTHSTNANQKNSKLRIEYQPRIASENKPQRM